MVKTARIFFGGGDILIEKHFEKDNSLYFLKGAKIYFKFFIKMVLRV
jgi:hypothetical protein